MICSSVKRLGFMSIPQRVMDSTHFWRRFRGSVRPRSRRSGGLRPPCSGLARPEHPPPQHRDDLFRLVSLPLPLQSSLMSKTCLKSDHFNGGG
jgi:hypothetical protein